MVEFSFFTNLRECCNCAIFLPGICGTRGAINDTHFRRWPWLWSIQSCWAWDGLKPHRFCVPMVPFSTSQVCQTTLTHKPCGVFSVERRQIFVTQLHRINNRLQQRFTHCPEHRSRLILDLDSTVVTVFGHQEQAEVGYNPRYRGKRSYNPLLCLEANSSLLWDTELRAGNAGTWEGSVELLASCFESLPADIRELRVRADAGFGFGPVLDILEARPAQYAVVARMTAGLKRRLGALHYERCNRQWESAELELRPYGWSQARRFIVARRRIEATEPEPTLFNLNRHLYRAWVTNLSLSPAGVCHFYDGRAGMEPRIYELRENFALRKIPTSDFAANALYLEVIRLAHNLVTNFQQACLPEDWRDLTLATLRYRLFWLPGELTRPQNRPTLRLANSPMVQSWTDKILSRIHQLKPLED
jgi:hypothetical protein